MRKISRSSHAAFRRCARKFYWGTIKDGTGYVGLTSPIELVVGIAFHRGAEILLRSNGDIEAAVKAGVEGLDGEQLRPEQPTPEKLLQWQELVEEQRALVEAMLRAWHRIRWARFIEEYDTLDVERERRTLLAPNVMLMSRSDFLIRRRMDGALLLGNWKTDGTGFKDWEKKWHYDVQMWTEALAEEHHYGEPLQGVLVEGLYKGTRKEGRQCTDLLYGYKSKGSDGEWEYTHKWTQSTKTKKWERFPAWKEDFPGGHGLAYWVNWMPWDGVEKYVMTSNPIIKNDTITQEWIRQVVRRETEIEAMLREEVSEDERLVYFDQNFDSYNCGRCPFSPICQMETTFEDMVNTGRLVKRVDHHAMEGEDS